MMNYTLFKTILISLIFGFLSISCMATESIYEDSVGDDKRSKTAEQINMSPQQLVFSGEHLLNIGLYLGRQEVGRLEQVSRSINNFFTQSPEGLRLYKCYAHQLHLEEDSRLIANKNDDKINWGEKIKGLKKQIVDYYELSIFPIINNNLRCMDICITCFNFDRSIFAGFSHYGRSNRRKTVVVQKDGRIQRLGLLRGGLWSNARTISADGEVIVGCATDGQNQNARTAVMWKNGKIKSLGLLYDGSWSEARDISADGKIVVGWAGDGQNNESTSVMWRDGKIQPLGFLHDGRWSIAEAISADGKVIVGCATDGQNQNARTSVIWRDGKIQSLGFLDGGYWSGATDTSADGKIIAGWAGDKDNKPTAVIWNGEKTVPLTNYQFNQPHDYLEKVMAVSRDGGDFIINSNAGKIYKVHIPRRDLWKIKSQVDCLINYN